MEERLWYGIGGFCAALGLMCLGVEMARDIIWCRLMLNRLHERKGRTRREENMVGFLISDSAIELAKVIAGMMNLNPVEQKDEFRKLCETFRQAFDRYEKQVDRMHRRLHLEAK